MGCDAGYILPRMERPAVSQRKDPETLGEALLGVWRKTDPPLSWPSVLTLGWAAGLTALETADGLSFLQNIQKIGTTGNWSGFHLTDS